MRTLPFPIDKLDKYRKGSAFEVDMSKTNFPEDLDPIKTSFIYLRNIGFNNITLNFSKVDKETKFKYLEEYLTTNIDLGYSAGVLEYTAVVILEDDKDWLKEPCILNKKEIEEFKERYKDLIHEFRCFAMSLPVYAMSRFKQTSEFALEIEKSDYDKIGINNFKYIEEVFMTLLANGEDSKYPPKFYNKYFTVENNVLMEAVERLPLMATLNALATSKDNICKQILDKGEELNED